jgi:hypothetical protein
MKHGSGAIIRMRNELNATPHDPVTPVDARYQYD